LRPSSARIWTWDARTEFNWCSTARSSSSLPADVAARYGIRQVPITVHYEVQGRYGWEARYVKEVDASETTVKFYQEIYDERGNLVEVHEKYPLDRGHRRL